MQQKLFQNFFITGASGNDIEKDLQKPHPKLKKNMNIKCLQRIFALPTIQ